MYELFTSKVNLLSGLKPLLIQAVAISAGKNSGLGRIWVGQIGQCQNSDKKLMFDTVFLGQTSLSSGQKSGSDNKNLRNVVSLKIHDHSPIFVFRFRQIRVFWLDKFFPALPAVNPS